MASPTRKPKDRYPYAKHPESKLCSSALEPGDHVFVQDAEGSVWVAPNGPHQHPKVLGGALAAAAAGELVMGDQGMIMELNNLSGTFRFGPETLDAVVESLRGVGLVVLDSAVKRYPEDFM